MKLFRKSSWGSKSDDRSSKGSARSARSARSAGSGGHNSGGSIDRKKALRPIRLMCLKKTNSNHNDDEELKSSTDDAPSRFSYSANSIVEYKCDQTSISKNERRDDINYDDRDDSCDERDSSFTDAPVHKFGTDKYRIRQKVRQRQDHCLVDDLTTIPSEANMRNFLLNGQFNERINDHIERHLYHVSEIPRGGRKKTEETSYKNSSILDGMNLVKAKRNHSDSDDSSAISRVSSLTSNTATLSSSSNSVSTSTSCSVSTAPIIYSPREQKRRSSHHSSRASRSRSSKRNDSYVCRSESVIYSNLDTIEEDDNSSRGLDKSSSDCFSSSVSESSTDSECRGKEPSVIYAIPRLKRLQIGNTANKVMSAMSVYTPKSTPYQPGCVGETFNFYLNDIVGEQREV